VRCAGSTISVVLRSLPAVPGTLLSGADDFVEALDDPCQLLGRGATQPATDALNGQRPYLADLDPAGG